MNLLPFLSIVLACIIWGLSPFFYKLLDGINAEIIMAFRIIFSLFFLLLMLFFQKKNFFIQKKTFLLIFVASFMIGINQFGFIYSISVKQVLQSSFAYFIFPLISVVFGMFFLNEYLNKTQITAVLFAIVSISLLSLGMESIPTISIVMGVTFAIYGLLKKNMNLDPLRTVALEIAILSPLAIFFLLFMIIYFPQHIQNLTYYNYTILLLSGFITAVPLWLFSMATLKLKYSTIGMINYLNPSIQFLIAITIFSEPFTSLHLFSFLIIWLSLVLYSFNSIRPSFVRSEKISSTESNTLK